MLTPLYNCKNTKKEACRQILFLFQLPNRILQVSHFGSHNSELLTTSIYFYLPCPRASPWKSYEIWLSPCHGSLWESLCLPACVLFDRWIEYWTHLIVAPCKWQSYGLLMYGFIGAIGIREVVLRTTNMRRPFQWDWKRSRELCCVRGVEKRSKREMKW